MNHKPFQTHCTQWKGLLHWLNQLNNLFSVYINIKRNTMKVLSIIKLFTSLLENHITYVKYNKRNLSLTLLFIFSLMFSNIQAQNVTVTITSDNAYVFGFGTVNGISNYFNPGVANKSAGEIYNSVIGPENYNITGSITGKYIYIAAWSDESTFQGTIAQFSDGNSTILTNPGVNWEVYATGVNLDPESNDPVPAPPLYTPRSNSNCPTLLDINNQITIANLNNGDPAITSVGWVGFAQITGLEGVLAFGHNNSLGPVTLCNSPYNFPPGTVQGIDQNAQWMWYIPDLSITHPNETGNIPCFPASMSKEYYIFRIGPLDSLFTGSICGIKFNDLNGNCRQDSLEQGLSGWTINLSGSGTFSTTTDSLGQYCFNSIPSGTYTVSEVQQTGWTQICPASPGIYNVTLNSGQNITGINFANKQETIPPDDCCDYLEIGPYDSDSESQFFGHQYTIHNQKEPSHSDICSIKVSINPTPVTYVAGGGVSTYLGSQPSAFVWPYTLVNLNPTVSPVNDPATDWVTFYFGTNWNDTGGPYFVTLTVIHCDGDSCIYHDTLNPKPVYRLSGLLEFDEIQDTLKAFNFKLKGNNNQKEAIKFVSVDLPRELGSIKAITSGCSNDDGRDNECDGMVEDSKMNKHHAFFILKNAITLNENEVSKAFTILYSKLPGTQLNPTIKVRLYNSKGDLIAYDSTDIISSADVEYEFKGYDGDEFELLKSVPNPAQESVSLYYIIGTESNIRLSLYNSLGNELKFLDEGFKPQGMHSIELNTEDLSSGVYYVKLVSLTRSTTIKVIINK